jgi:hypothetical protein
MAYVCITTVEAAIDRLLSVKNLRTITVFTPNGLKIPKKIRITKQRVSTYNPTFLVTYGNVNYAERKFADKFFLDNGAWPTILFKTFPKKKKDK